MLTECTPKDPPPDLHIFVRELARAPQIWSIHVHPQIDNHPKRQARVQPGGAPLVTQRKEGVCHDQQGLDGRDLAAVEGASQQVAHALPELPAGGAHIVVVAADLAAWAELGGAKVDGVEKYLGEVRAGAGHVPHESRPVRDTERVVLPVPVEGQEVHPQFGVHTVKVQRPGTIVELF